MKRHEGLFHSKYKVGQNTDDSLKIKRQCWNLLTQGECSAWSHVVSVAPFTISGLFVDFAPFCCLLIMTGKGQKERKSAAAAPECKIHNTTPPSIQEVRLPFNTYDHNLALL